MTLPFAKAYSHATFTQRPSASSQLLCVHRGHALRECRDHEKALEAARLTAHFLGESRLSGFLTVRTQQVIGHGLGSSTTDVVATIRAVAQWFGVTLGRDSIARIAVRAECASDPLMYSTRTPLLFAHHDGHVLERFAKPLPRFIVVGARDASVAPVVTQLRTPPQYTRSELRQFNHLLQQLRLALTTNNVALLGRVSTISARINQRYFPNEIVSTFERLAVQYNAAGIQIAHSGNVCGAIFTKTTNGRRNALRLAQASRTLGLTTYTFCSQLGTH